MAGFLSAITDVTPGSTDLFVDVDLSTYLPNNAAGALFFVRTPTSAATVGWRKKGSTDIQTFTVSGGPKTFGFGVGVDGNQVCQINTSSTSCKFYAVGWLTTDEAIFFTNAIDKTPSTTGSWQNVDISADTGTNTATGAILTFAMSSALATGARMNGSTDSRIPIVESGGAIVGVDGGEVCQVNISTGTTVYLQGYVIANATFHTNAIDVSLANTGSYVDFPALGSTQAVGAIYEVVSTSSTQHFYIRRKGNSDDFSTNSGPNTRHSWLFVACDDSQLCQGKIDSTSVDFFEVGYFTGPRTVSLTGVSATASPGAFGTMVQRTLTGVVGTGAVETMAIQALKILTDVAGSSSVGTITSQTLTSLVGVEGAIALGALLADLAQRVYLTGVESTTAAGTFAAAAQIVLNSVGTTGGIGALAWQIALALDGVAGTMGIDDITVSDNWLRAASKGINWAEPGSADVAWTDTSVGSTLWTKPNQA